MALTLSELESLFVDFNEERRNDIALLKEFHKSLGLIFERLKLLEERLDRLQQRGALPVFFDPRGGHG